MLAWHESRARDPLRKGLNHECQESGHSCGGCSPGRRCRGAAVADSGAQGAALNSPGFLSGNLVQIPVHVPINACGNSLNAFALLNPTAGNTCVNA